MNHAIINRPFARNSHIINRPFCTKLSIPVNWGCIICWMHLCRGVRNSEHSLSLPQWVSWIFSIDETLIDTTTPSQREFESNGNEEVLQIPQTPRLESHHQMQFNVIARILKGFKFCNLTLIILFNIINLFAHFWIVSSLVNDQIVLFDPLMGP